MILKYLEMQSFSPPCSYAPLLTPGNVIAMPSTYLGVDLLLCAHQSLETSDAKDMYGL